MNIVPAANAPCLSGPPGGKDVNAPLDGIPDIGSKELGDQTNFLAVLIVLQMGVQMPGVAPTPLAANAPAPSAPPGIVSDSVSAPGFGVAQISAATGAGKAGLTTAPARAPEPPGGKIPAPIDSLATAGIAPPPTFATQIFAANGAVKNAATSGITQEPEPSGAGTSAPTEADLTPVTGKESPPVPPVVLDRVAPNVPTTPTETTSPTKAESEVRAKVSDLGVQAPTLPAEALIAAARWEPEHADNTKNTDDPVPALVPGLPTSSTAQMPTQAVEEKPPAPALADQIGARFDGILDHLRQHGRAEMQMDLHPPEMGRMQLHVTLDDLQIEVRLIVQNDGAKQALDQQLEPLRLRFAEMGLSLGQFDVRREGSGANQEPPTPSENPRESSQSGRIVGDRRRNIYGVVANPNALVDVLA